MIAGIVRDEIEVVVSLELLNALNQLQPVDFILDSGFTGYLSLSHEIVQQLGLNPRGTQEGQLADGSVSFCQLVNVTVIWNGIPQRLEAQILGEPLIGTRLLKGFELRAKFVRNGEVTINALSSPSS